MAPSSRLPSQQTYQSLDKKVAPRPKISQMPFLDVELEPLLLGNVWAKAGGFKFLPKTRFPGGSVVMGHLSPVCPGMRLVPQNKSLLPHRDKFWGSVQEKACKCKVEKQPLKLASTILELCDLG